MIRAGTAFIVACVVALGGQPARAAGTDAKPLSVELNKLEPTGKGCRVFFVVDNTGDKAVQTLKLDLVFFGADGVVIRRLVVDVAPISSGKKRVKSFELDDPPCSSIGSILLNDVSECRDAAGPQTDCLQRMAISSRAKVPLTK